MKTRILEREVFIEVATKDLSSKKREDLTFQQKVEVSDYERSISTELCYGEFKYYPRPSDEDMPFVDHLIHTIDSLNKNLEELIQDIRKEIYYTKKDLLIISLVTKFYKTHDYPLHKVYTQLPKDYYYNTILELYDYLKKNDSSLNLERRIRVIDSWTCEIFENPDLKKKERLR